MRKVSFLADVIRFALWVAIIGPFGTKHNQPQLPAAIFFSASLQDFKIQIQKETKRSKENKDIKKKNLTHYIQFSRDLIPTFINMKIGNMVEFRVRVLDVGILRTVANHLITP